MRHNSGAFRQIKSNIGEELTKITKIDGMECRIIRDTTKSKDVHAI